MKLSDLFENTTRLRIVVTGDWKTRVFAEGFLKASAKNWIDKARYGDDDQGDPVVSATYDIAENGTCLYRNRVDSHLGGRALATELQEFMFAEAKKHGLTKTSGYIESSNIASKQMAERLGLKITLETEHGAYYGKDL